MMLDFSMEVHMRTTLDIEDDVLIAVKELARRERVSAGRILSRLAREALVGRDSSTIPAKEEKSRVVGGFRPFPQRGVVVSNEQIERLREQEGI